MLNRDEVCTYRKVGGVLVSIWLVDWLGWMLLWDFVSVLNWYTNYLYSVPCFFFLHVSDCSSFSSLLLLLLLFCRSIIAAADDDDDVWADEICMFFFVFVWMLYIYKVCMANERQLRLKTCMILLFKNEMMIMAMIMMKRWKRRERRKQQTHILCEIEIVIETKAPKLHHSARIHYFASLFLLLLLLLRSV